MSDQEKQVHQNVTLLIEQFLLFQQGIRKSPSQKNIEHTPLLANAFLQLAKSEPIIFIALLHTPIKTMPFVYRYIFNSAIVSTILSLRHHLHDSAILQIICSVLTVHAKRHYLIQQWSQNITPETADTTTLQQHFQLPITLVDNHPLWHHCNQINWTVLSDFSQLNRLQQHSMSQQIIIIASQLALLITPGKGRSIYYYAHGLRKLSGALPIQAYAHIEKLLEVSGLYPAGITVKLSTNEMAKVLSITPQGLLVKLCQSDGTAGQRIELINPQDIVNYMPTKTVTDLSAYWPQWWDNNWLARHQEISHKSFNRLQPLYFRVDIPPPTLTDLHSQLMLAEPDTQALTQLISSEQSLADYIQLQASQSSRQKMLIRNVKQALLMHGFDRTYSIICQQALTLRLSQLDFPCAQRLLQFSQLRSAIAAQLTHLSPLPLLPEEAQCMTSFASSGLFTHPTLRILPDLRINSQQCCDMTLLFPIKQPELLTEHAIKLAQYWQLNSSQIDAIRFGGRLSSQGQKRSLLTRQMAALLGLSLALAQQSYFTISSQDEEQQQELQLALQILGINQQQANQALMQAIEHTKPYSNLH